MRWIFWGFCRNWFLIDPLHYLSSRSDFGFEFGGDIRNQKTTPRLGESVTLRVGESATLRVGDSMTLLVGESMTHRLGESAFEC
jgi:hypothetical protein